MKVELLTLFKIIALLYFTLLVIKTKATLNSSSLSLSSSPLLNETYIKTLQNYDMQVEMLKQPFNASFAVINTQLEMPITNVMTMEQFIGVFQNINALSKAYVEKYITSLPTPEATMSSMGNCILTAENKLNQTLSAPLATKSYL